MPELFPPTLDEEILEVEREIKTRGVVYPRLVNTGRMMQSRATRQIEIMGCVLTRLRNIKNEEEGR